MSDDAKPNMPPQRFEQRGNWKHLITDEQEWLARPARWGIAYLPESTQGAKGQLFDHHYYGRMSAWIACPVCRPLVREAFAEDGIRIPDLLVVPREGFEYRACREKFQSWYSGQHQDGRCEAWGCIRSLNLYECGLVTATELHNRLIDGLYDLAHRLGREEQTARYPQSRGAWEVELALEIVGPNPFRPVTFDAEWRSYTALSLAKHIYEARDFSTMPILADALQDAGCDNADILNHCRDPKQVHVRGCWVVDLVLGKS